MAMLSYQTHGGLCIGLIYLFLWHIWSASWGLDITVWMSVYPPSFINSQLDPNFYGLLTSAILFIAYSLLISGNKHVSIATNSSKID